MNKFQDRRRQSFRTFLLIGGMLFCSGMWYGSELEKLGHPTIKPTVQEAAMLVTCGTDCITPEIARDPRYDLVEVLGIKSVLPVRAVRRMIIEENK